MIRAMLELGEFSDGFRYRLVRELARGGMGVVYEATQLGAAGFEKRVALKVIRPEVTESPELLQMFQGEARLVADLVHENIVQIYHLGRIGPGLLYMSMELIDGISLEDFVLRHQELERPLPMELCLFVVSRVCRALEYAHGRTDREGRPLGIVHRDVSPGNVLMTWGGAVKLTDFGVAKARHVMRDLEGELLLGKARYMSPEQARFEPTDRRSDVFAAGIVLHELLSGQPLFAGADTLVSLDQVISQDVPPLVTLAPHVPPDVCAVVERALQRDPDRRFPTAGRMGHELEQLLYADRFGPTNISLHRYLRRLYPLRAPALTDPGVPDPWSERLAREEVPR